MFFKDIRHSCSLFFLKARKIQFLAEILTKTAVNGYKSGLFYSVKGYIIESL